MTRSQFFAAGFDYEAPAGDPLRWRMLDVRVYRHHQRTADEQFLYALWHVGESSYVLASGPADQQPEAVYCRLPMHDPDLLRQAVADYFKAHGGPMLSHVFSFSSMSTAQELATESAMLEEYIRDYRVIVASNPGLRAELSFEAYLVFAMAKQRDKVLRSQLENIIHLLNRIDH